MIVPFFNYGHVYGQYEKELKEILIDVSKRGSFIMQQEVKNFENNLSKYLNTKYALGVGNCTDGLLLSIKAAGIKPGDEVIFSSHTFVATASAIYHSGATPVPVECGKDHLISIQSIKDNITDRTRAIIPTQLNGHVCEMNEIMKLCNEHNLILIEDAAQSIGAKYMNKHVGNFGLAGAFSFYPAKVIGCFGDGGAVVTNDDELFNKVFLTRDHGREKIGEVVTWGMNSRLDSIHAAILDFKLKKYNLDIIRRREIASIYQSGLGDIKEIVLPRPPDYDKNKFEIFQNYEIEVTDADDRSKLVNYLKSNNIGTILQWGGKAVHEFKGLGFNVSLPFTEDIMRRSFLLPMNTSLSNQDVNYVIDTIRNFYGYGK